MASQALRDVSLTIPPGMYRLLGPNGGSRARLQIFPWTRHRTLSDSQLDNRAATRWPCVGGEDPAAYAIALPSERGRGGTAYWVVAPHRQSEPRRTAEAERERTAALHAAGADMGLFAGGGLKLPK
jgi:hypothetical protein